jgi:hypothetical protein
LHRLRVGAASIDARAVDQRHLVLTVEQRPETSSRNQEVEDVKQAVVQGYINGVFLQTDLALMEKYWHPDCDICQYQNGKMVRIPAITYFREASKRVKAPYDPTVTHTFVDVRVKGYAAVAVVEIRSLGAYRYTDFLNLYKFADGWRIQPLDATSALAFFTAWARET